MSVSGSIVDVPGVKVGHAHDFVGLTGCTVILTENGALAGVDVRGSAPGTRETDLLSPVNLVQQVHAICLSGGSAFGLDAASGVMTYLEERGFGLNVGIGVVPIVPAAVIFDLAIGDAKARPNAAMGYQACLNANSASVQEGNVGAGCGATVGKLAGHASAMKSGLGTASVRLSNGLVVGAIVAVNAVGNIRDPDTGEWVAGARGEDGGLLSPSQLREHTVEMGRGFSDGRDTVATNTTIAVVASNSILAKAQATKVAQMAHDGLARTIYPVHTMHDGDTVFALATGEMNANVDLVGVLSAEVLATAILRAVRTAKPAGGLPSASSAASRRFTS